MALAGVGCGGDDPETATDDTTTEVASPVEETTTEEVASTEEESASGGPSATALEIVDRKVLKPRQDRLDQCFDVQEPTTPEGGVNRLVVDYPQGVAESSRHLVNLLPLSNFPPEDPAGQKLVGFFTSAGAGGTGSTVTSVPTSHDPDADGDGTPTDQERSSAEGTIANGTIYQTTGVTPDRAQEISDQMDRDETLKTYSRVLIGGTQFVAAEAIVPKPWVIDCYSR